MRRLINRHPDRASALILGVLPFIVILIVYLVASNARLAENANDKLMPAFSTLGDTVHQLAFDEDQRTGQVTLWADTWASLGRLGLGLGFSAVLGLTFGIALGVIPYLRATLASFVAALSMIPPLAILPILFIVFGLGELSKVVLIVFGVAPIIMRDMAMRVADLPHEQIVKAQSLGASTWLIVLRVVLPQMWPRLVDAVRLTLGSAWLFLIAAEAIASTEGLGYRIFLVRRYMSMDIILPYVVWITLLAFLMDYGLKVLSARAFPWYSRGR
jgi:NitT/TauT family transport system permease protein